MARDVRPELGHLGRELLCSPRGLAEPERHRWRGALRVDDPDGARLDAADAPRRRPQQEDVAGHALDGPVLVHRADEGLVGLGHHAVVAELGDGAT